MGCGARYAHILVVTVKGSRTIVGLSIIGKTVGRKAVRDIARGKKVGNCHGLRRSVVSSFSRPGLRVGGLKWREVRSRLLETKVTKKI